MSERPFVSSRNQRKHFVKCVDCGCQTLPHNATGDRPWAAAAALYINGCANYGPLCFECANKRRKLLGLPLERGRDGGAPITDRGGAAFLPPGAAPPKKIRINKQEYIWDVGSLDSLIVKWKEQQLDERFRSLDATWWLVVVNNRSVPAVDFSSVPISDGDEISIVLGRGRYF